MSRLLINGLENHWNVSRGSWYIAFRGVEIVRSMTKKPNELIHEPLTYVTQKRVQLSKNDKPLCLLSHVNVQMQYDSFFSSYEQAFHLFTLSCKHLLLSQFGLLKERFKKT